MLLLSLIYVGFLMLSNVTGARVIEIPLDWLPFLGADSVGIPAALIAFPMTYAFSTIITEVYGYSVSRMVIWGGLVVNLMFVIGMWLLTLPPGLPSWEAENPTLAAAYPALAFEFARTFVASTVAYFCGEFVNTTFLAKLKVASAGRHLGAHRIEHRPRRRDRQHAVLHDPVLGPLARERCADNDRHPGGRQAAVRTDPAARRHGRVAPAQADGSDRLLRLSHAFQPVLVPQLNAPPAAREHVRRPAVATCLSRIPT